MGASPMGQEKTPLGQRVYRTMKYIRQEILHHCSTINVYLSIVYHEKDINGATVIENLLPDTLHRPVDSLTEGGLHLSHRQGAR